MSPPPAARGRTSTVTSRSSVPRTTRSVQPVARRERVERLVEGVDAARAAARRPPRSGRRARCRPPRRGSRPRRSGPARPSRSGRPTARRRRRATRGGAIATPRRTRPRALAAPQPLGARRRARSSAGIATIRPPSRRTAFRPSRRPSRSTSGPPPEPRGSGAVCSMQPAIVRPRGPADARGPRTRRTRASRAVRARRGSRARSRACRCCGAGARGLPRDRLDVAGLDRDGGEVEVGVDAGDRPVSRRPSAKVTVTSSPRRLWAFVRTRPGATTTPLPRPQPAAEADDGGADPLGGRADRLLKVGDGAQCCCPSCC